MVYTNSRKMVHGISPLLIEVNKESISRILHYLLSIRTPEITINLRGKLMWQILGSMLGLNLIESFVDNVVRDTVDEPSIGAVVYCDLAFGTMEHSGIYIGRDTIIHLNGDGVVETVSPREFLDGTTAISIYTSCFDSWPIGSSQAAERAIRYKNSIGAKNYNILLDNCHMFTSACLTGDLENADTFLWMLKHTAKEHECMLNNWRVWNYK